MLESFQQRSLISVTGQMTHAVNPTHKESGILTLLNLTIGGMFTAVALRQPAPVTFCSCSTLLLLRFSAFSPLLSNVFLFRAFVHRMSCFVHVKHFSGFSWNSNSCVISLTGPKNSFATFLFILPPSPLATPLEF